MALGGVAIPAEDEAARKEILCENAPPGSVVKLPALVEKWVTVLCTSGGHALAPQVSEKATVWVARTDGRPFMLLAAPGDWKRPDELSKYDIRFTAFEAAERTGAALQKTLNMWDLAFKGTSRPTIEHVIQLDARSVWLGSIYNLFFYVVDGRPRWIIACMDSCKLAAAIDVVDISKAGAR